MMNTSAYSAGRRPPILDEDGLVELNNSCGDDGVSACDFEFAQEIEYTEGSLLSDPLTGGTLRLQDLQLG